MEGRYNVERFLNAQNDGTYGATYKKALKEIRHGGKSSHWIWYVFPQIKGIPGVHSFNAQLFALAGPEEAKAFMDNEVLSCRMREILGELLRWKGRKSILTLMGGEMDARKLCSSMTIFYCATQEQIFKEIIDTFFWGSVDHTTIRIINNLRNNQ